MPYVRKLYEHKDDLPNGFLLSVKIEEIDDARFVHNMRYSMTLSRNGRRELGYDNYHGQPHKHLGVRRIQQPYTDPWELLGEFFRAAEDYARSHPLPAREP